MGRKHKDKKEKKEKKKKRSSLDEELLGLVSDKPKKKSGKRKKKDSESESEIEDTFSDEVEISDEEEEIEEEPAPKKRGKKSAKPKKAGPAVADDDDEKFDDGYDQNLLGDDKDREYILSLNEVEREQIIAERYQRRKEALERFELKKKLKRQQASGQVSPPRRAPKRLRTGSGSSKETALSDLKKRRQASGGMRGSGRGGADSDEESPALSSDDDDVSGASDSESEAAAAVESRPAARVRERAEDLEQAREPTKQRDERKEAAAAEQQQQQQQQQAAAEAERLTKAELQKLTLPRTWLEAKLDEPYFDKLVTGFFVRIGIGLSNDRLPVYRVAEIIDVGTGKKTYKLGKKDTNKVLTLKHGASSKPFTLENVSNKDFTDGEFQKWLHEMDKQQQHVLTSAEAKQRAAKFSTYKNYQYTEEDIAMMVKKKGKESKVNIPAKRKEVQAKKEAAMEVNDEETVAKCDRELSELDRLERRERERQDQARTAMLLKINERSRQENIQEKKISNEVLYADPDLDPFSRRQTRTSYVPTSVQEIARMAAKKDADEKKAAAEAAAAVAEQERVESGGVPISPSVSRFAPGESPKGAGDDKNPWRTASQDGGELAGIHDFDLDALRPATPVLSRASSAASSASSPVPAAAVPKPATPVEAPKRTALSINDYKKRLGLL